MVKFTQDQVDQLNLKIKTTDEFLVEKRDPLIFPPDYDKIPEPGTKKKPEISEEEKSSFRNMCLMLNVDEDEIEGVINSGHDLKQVLNEVITLHGYLSWSVEKLSDLACTLVNKYIAGQSSAIGLMNQFVSLQVRGKLFKKGWRQLWLILQKVIVIFVRLLQASRIYWLVRSL